MNYDINTEEGMENSVKWQSRMCTALAEGAKWGVPITGSIYTIYQSKKLALGVKRDSDIDRVFKATGWEVRDEK